MTITYSPGPVTGEERGGVRGGGGQELVEKWQYLWSGKIRSFSRTVTDMVIISFTRMTHMNRLKNTVQQIYLQLRVIGQRWNNLK